VAPGSVRSDETARPEESIPEKRADDFTLRLVQSRCAMSRLWGVGLRVRFLNTASNSLEDKTIHGPPGTQSADARRTGREIAEGLWGRLTRAARPVSRRGERPNGVHSTQAR
jgi:hypothetical protein